MSPTAHTAARPYTSGSTALAPRRLRRMVAHGPRCPDCAGPLVFGEGCNICPVCGYSGCEAGLAARP